MCLILSLGIVAPLTSFTVFVNDAKSIEYAVKDADEFLNLKVLDNAAERVKLENYNIELDRVSFSYETAWDEQADRRAGNVLTEISLKLEEGTFTALVGPSGSGKSKANSANRSSAVCAICFDQDGSRRALYYLDFRLTKKNRDHYTVYIVNITI